MTLNMGHEVCIFFKEVQDKLSLPEVRINDHNDIFINSGFTKLYFLLIDDFIMYDGRVGAALGLLGRQYAEESGLKYIPEDIKFAFGSGKVGKSGKQSVNRRNPSIPPYKLPAFTGNQQRHLNDNIKASWLLKNITDRTKSRLALLQQDPPLNERLTAIQSALFMIGYDVRGKKL